MEEGQHWLRTQLGLVSIARYVHAVALHTNAVGVLWIGQSRAAGGFWRLLTADNGRGGGRATEGIGERRKVGLLEFCSMSAQVRGQHAEIRTLGQFPTHGGGGEPESLDGGRCARRETDRRRQEREAVL